MPENNQTPESAETNGNSRSLDALVSTRFQYKKDVAAHDITENVAPPSVAHHRLVSCADEDLRAENLLLRQQIYDWAKSLPEHWKWDWLRDEMIGVARAKDGTANDQAQPRKPSR